MLTTALYFIQCVAEISLMGTIEAASVALIIYFIFAKTRAPAIIANLFPNLNLNYRTPLGTFNNLGHEFLLTFRSTPSENEKNETKPQISLAHGIGSQNMLQLTPHAGRKPYNSLLDWGAVFPYVAQSVRSKKFIYPQISDLVLKDAVLHHAIKQSAEQLLREQRYAKSNAPMLTRSPSLDAIDDSDTYQNILKSQEKRAVSIVTDMNSKLNNFLLSFTSWLLYKLLPCFLSGVVTHTKQIEMLKAVSERSPGTPLIFVPLHRSHLDYIMVTFILTNNDIRSPLVAAGNNLQIPIFGGLLRGLGAFFIKRKIDPVEGKKDVLYRAALHLYLQHALKMGHNVEFFIEGGRTRTGKPCMPKGGLLSVIVNAFLDGSIPDALLVPVSVNYERLVDGNFVREQKGERKIPETFGKAISGIWKALNSNYGLMRIDFNEPYSIRELVNTYNKINKEEGIPKPYKPTSRTLQHNQSTSSLYGTDVVCEEHRNLIESISRQVVFDSSAATSVMSTNALSFLLLTRYRKGAEDKEIAKGLDDLCLSLKTRKDIGFSGDSLHVVNYATDLLGSTLITRTEDDKGRTILCPVQTVESFIELAYYSNMLIPCYALRSILLITFHGLLPQPRELGKKEIAGVTRRKLIDTAVQNCQVFRYEFILHKPTQELRTLLDETLDDLFIENLVQGADVQEDPDVVCESRRIAKCIENFMGSDSESDDEIELPETPDIFHMSTTVAKQRELCEVIAPFGTTYLAVAQALKILHKNSMLETEFISFVINDLNKKIKNETCAYAESISTDSVRNCLKTLEKWSVIEVSTQRGLRLISLCLLYEAAKDSLKHIIDRISQMVPNYNNGYFV